MAELLEHFEVSRFENPYVFAILVANSKDSYPQGEGRPIKVSLNSGRGMFFIAARMNLNGIAISGPLSNTNWDAASGLRPRVGRKLLVFKFRGNKTLLMIRYKT